MRSEERPVSQPSEKGPSNVNDAFARWFIPENPRLNQSVCLQENVEWPFFGHRVFVSAICNAGWSCALFASYLQWIVGPFAMIVSQEPCVFAMIVG